jgi:hypothetical protein
MPQIVIVNELQLAIIAATPYSEGEGPPSDERCLMGQAGKIDIRFRMKLRHGGSSGPDYVCKRNTLIGITP